MVGPPLVVIGFDAADRRLVRALAAEGRLPTLASMLARGAEVEIETPFATLVGGVWRDFMTATTVSRHGHYCFEQLVPGTYEIRRTSGELPEPPFWGALAASGRDVAVIDVPFTDVRERSATVQVVDWGRHDNHVGLTTYPTALAADIEREYGSLPTDACDLYINTGRAVELRNDLLASIPRKTRLLCDLIGRQQWDLFIGVFHETHCAGHQFWRQHDPTHPAHDVELAGQIGDPLVSVLEAHDAALGQIIEAAGPEATVFALYSHGMGSHYDATFLLNWMLRRIDGIPDRPSRAEVARIKWSQFRDRRQIAREASAGRRDRFRGHVDAKQRFFSVPNQDIVGAIRLNVVDREPHGLVQPGSEFDEVCGMLERRLREWVNVDTGEPIVERVVLRRDLYDDSSVCALPDLYVEWNRSSPIRCIEAPELGRIERDYTGSRTGDHYPGGLLVGIGPGVQPGTHAAMRTLDIGPTFVDALGAPLPGVDGRAHPSLMAAQR